MSLPIDDTIAQYPLLNCNIASVAFEKGVITFAQLAIELHLVVSQVEEDEAGGEIITETSLMPLVVSYESLLSIKVPGRKFIQLTSPSDIIQSWAATNEMEFPEGSIETDITLITLDLEMDYINEICKEVAPAISAIRRARSSSRWSATELLPLKSYTVALASQAPTAVATMGETPVGTGVASIHHHEEEGPTNHSPIINAHPAVQSIAEDHHEDHQDEEGESQEKDRRCSPERTEDAAEPQIVEDHAAFEPVQATPSNAQIHTPDEGAIRLPRRAIRRSRTPETSSLPSSIASPRTSTASNRNSSDQKKLPRPTATRVILDESSLLRTSTRTSTRVTALIQSVKDTMLSAPTVEARKPQPLSKKKNAPVVASSSDDDDDVPLGTLVGALPFHGAKASLSSTIKFGTVGEFSATRSSGVQESENVKYDFCDLSSPSEIKVIVPQPAKSAKGRSTGSGRASGASSTRTSAGTNSSTRKSGSGSGSGDKDKPKKKVTISGDKEAPPVPIMDIQKSVPLPSDNVPDKSAFTKPSNQAAMASIPPTVSYAAALPTDDPKHNVAAATGTRHATIIERTSHVNGGVTREDMEREGDATQQPYLRRGPSRVRMPTPSLARPSMARPLERAASITTAKGVTLVSNDDADAASLKKLLDKGLGEDNLEEFMKSAVRLGRRAKQAKRQREESIVNAPTCPGDLVELARCATELLQICAEERDSRRAKYFRFFTKKVSSIMSQCEMLSQQLNSVIQTKDGLHAELQSMISTLVTDQLRWDTVERDDVEAAITSIHEKLVGPP